MAATSTRKKPPPDPVAVLQAEYDALDARLRVNLYADNALDMATKLVALANAITAARAAR